MSTLKWFITGVSSGLGRAIARAALDRGDHVAGTVRAADDEVAFAAVAPARARAYRLDVTDHDRVDQVIAQAWGDLEGIDIVVNNAGYALVGAVEEASAAAIRKQFEVNVFGPLAILRAILPLMRARRSGHIIQMTSVSGLVGWPCLGVYAGSKHALEGISEVLAAELAPLGLKVTMVEPGGFRTDFSGRSMIENEIAIADYAATAGRNRQILADHYGHQPGDPAKLAEAILMVVDAEKTPLRLVLGADALGYVAAKAAKFQSELEVWRPVSLGTDFGSP
jgi:NAD(P)-dependent dehydrogenase (short-subunit alcohol dehydrogenase family)